jgi:hypothetical protein
MDSRLTQGSAGFFMTMQWSSCNYPAAGEVLLPFFAAAKLGA